MKVGKFKVLLYLKERAGQDRQGPDHGRITLNRTMAQFSCKPPVPPGYGTRELD